MKAANRLQSRPLKDAASWDAHNVTQRATCSAQIETPKTTPRWYAPQPAHAGAHRTPLPPSLSACLREASLPPSSGQASPATTSLCRPGQPRTAPLRPRLRKAGAAAGLPRGPSPPQTGEGGPRGAAAGRVRCKGWRRLTASRRVAPLPLLPFGASSSLVLFRLLEGREVEEDTISFFLLSRNVTFAPAWVSCGST